MTRRQIIQLIAVAVIFSVFGWWEYTRAPSQNTPPVQQPAGTPKTVEFDCGGGKKIGATFYIGADKQVDLRLSDGRNLSVPRAMSASGARYANADESFVFWNKGDTAFIEENGRTTFENCVLK